MENKNFIYGIAAVKFGEAIIGYIEKGSWDWGGQKPEVTDVDAEQVPDAPVLTLVDSDGTLKPTFSLIQLDYSNLLAVMGGSPVINERTGGVTGWEAPGELVMKHGEWRLDFLSGQTMTIPEGMLAANLGGKLTLTEVSKLECQLTINKPSDGGKPYSIGETAVPAMVQAVNAGIPLKLFTSEETGSYDETFDGWVYYTRMVEFNGHYYSVPSKCQNTRNYAAQPSHYGKTAAVQYSYEPDVLFYAESEDLTIETGGWRGEEIVPERASGGEWHRMLPSTLAGVFPLENLIDHAAATGALIIGGRNMGTSVAVLEVGYYTKDALGNVGGFRVFETLSWESSQHAEKSTVLYLPDGYDPTNALIGIRNGSNVTSNVCIDYVIVERENN